MLEGLVHLENQRRAKFGVFVFEDGGVALAAQGELAAVEGLRAEVQHQREAAAFLFEEVVVPEQLVARAVERLRETAAEFTQRLAAGDFLQPAQKCGTVDGEVQQPAGALRGEFHFAKAGSVSAAGAEGDAVADANNGVQETGFKQAPDADGMKLLELCPGFFRIAGERRLLGPNLHEITQRRPGAHAV